MIFNYISFGKLQAQEFLSSGIYLTEKDKADLYEFNPSFPVFSILYALFFLNRYGGASGKLFLYLYENEGFDFGDNERIKIAEEKNFKSVEYDQQVEEEAR